MPRLVLPASPRPLPRSSMRRTGTFALLLSLLSLTGCAGPAAVPSPPAPSAAPTPAGSAQSLDLGGGVLRFDDLVYDRVAWDGTPHALLLDLYLPAGGPHPVVVFIHGGGWIEGGKDPCPGELFADHGYAMACIDYRLADPDAGCPAGLGFPAQIEDVRSAVRWLRQHADEFALDPTRFAAAGDSAGGHLTALLAVSAGEASLQGTGNPGPSDAVQAAVDWYGPVDPRLGPEPAFAEDPCQTGVDFLAQRYGETFPGFGLTLAWASLLGGSLTDPAVLARAALASPLSHIDASDPPLLIVHGEADDIVPIDQSQALADALAAAGVDVTFVRLPAIGHNYARFGPPGQYVDPAFLDPTLSFLARVRAAP